MKNLEKQSQGRVASTKKSYPRWRKYHPELIKKALQMYEEGFSTTVIEAELGIPKSTVHNYRSGQAKIANLDRVNFVS